MAVRTKRGSRQTTRAKPLSKRAQLRENRAQLRTRYRRAYTKKLGQLEEPARIPTTIKQGLHERRAASRVQKGVRNIHKEIDDTEMKLVSPRKIIKSTVIKELVYNQKTRTIWARFPNNNWYPFPNKSYSVFLEWSYGKQACKSNDPRKRFKRWWMGKYPSLGAYYNAKIKGKQ